MGDRLDSDNNLQTLIERIKQVEEIHADGGFKITKWALNNRDLLAKMGTNEPTTNKCVSTNTSVLGLNWVTQTDTLSFSWRSGREIVDSERAPTKRELLSVAMAVLDPLGLISFLTVVPCIILR